MKALKFLGKGKMALIETAKNGEGIKVLIKP
jgi:hypothetical protein